MPGCPANAGLDRNARVMYYARKSWETPRGRGSGVPEVVVSSLGEGLAMEARQSGRGLGPVGFVSVSISLCAAAVLAALALSNVRGVTAQASASGGSGSAYAVLPDSSDLYIIPPDTDIGIPMPPGEGLLEEFVEVWVIQPPQTPDNALPLLCPRKKPPANNQKALVRARGDPDWGAYSWSCTTDPNAQPPVVWQATGPEALFESQKTGTYNPLVDYFVT